jgi:hypothetical protein
MAAMHGWAAVIAEHEREVGRFLATVRRVSPADWNVAPADGKWSPAAVALHVCQSYEFATAAAGGSVVMRMRVSSRAASLYRTLLLPVMLATRFFPTGVRAPAEVRPDLALAAELSADEAEARLRQSANAASAALRQASQERPSFRIVHAYFGPLTPRAALRMLSAHTRHHARTLHG